MRPLSLQYKGAKERSKVSQFIRLASLYIGWVGLSMDAKSQNIDTWWVLDGDLYIVDLQDFTMQRYKNL